MFTRLKLGPGVKIKLIYKKSKDSWEGGIISLHYSLCPDILVVVALNEVHQTLFEPGRHCVRMHGLHCEPGRLNAVPKRQTLRDGGSSHYRPSVCLC